MAYYPGVYTRVSTYSDWIRKLDDGASAAGKLGPVLNMSFLVAIILLFKHLL